MKRDTIIWVLLLAAGAAGLAWRASTRGFGNEYITVSEGVYTNASAMDYAAGVAQFDLTRTIGLWVAAMLTLCIFSFLFRDNPLYKLAEAIVVGVSAAYWMVIGFWTVLIPNLIGPIFPGWVQSWAMPGLSPLRDEGWYWNIIPLVLGVMLLWRLAPKGGWISRWPLAFIIGTMAGLRLVGFFQADFTSQISNSILPLAVMEDGSYDFWASVRNILIVLGILACLVYFFFSFEHKGAVGQVARVGIWVLMITFGAAFGYTVMGRIALLAIRFEFLFDDWLWLIDPTGQRLGL